MAKRKRVGIVFNYYENWMGGNYYFLNLVNALNFVKDQDRPIISIISNKQKAFEFLRGRSDYPYLEFYHSYVRLSLIKRVFNKLIAPIFPQLRYRSGRKHLDMVFQYYADQSIDIEPLVNWIPDFQEKFLPENFSSEEINLRQDYYERIAGNAGHVVFSSNNTRDHFDRFFPLARSKRHVLHFAVIHPEFDSFDTDTILRKYEIAKPYFFVPNQFWVHKSRNLQ